jgi:hypothetical protein
MPLEDSPKITTPVQELLTPEPAVPDPTLKQRKMRRLMIISTALCLVLIAYNLYQVATRPPAPGGLEGCLVNLAGSLVQARIKVGQAAMVTGEDGCFFFAALPAGAQQLQIETSAGQWARSVVILSDQAVNLGSLSLNPAEKMP